MFTYIFEDMDGGRYRINNCLGLDDAKIILRQMTTKPIWNFIVVDVKRVVHYEN